MRTILERGCGKFSQYLSAQLTEANAIKYVLIIIVIME